MIISEGTFGAENAYGFATFGTAFGGEFLAGIGYLQPAQEYSGFLLRGNNPTDYADTSAEMYWGEGLLTDDSARVAVGEDAGLPSATLYSMVSSNLQGIRTSTDGILVQDSQADIGMLYDADYSGDGLSDSLWIPNWGAITNQNVYENSGGAGITTTVAEDSFSIQGGTATDTDKNIESKNNAGTTTAYIQADGLSHAVTGQYPHITTPGNPAAGNLKVYSKADNELYILDSAGVEKKIASF